MKRLLCRWIPAALGLLTGLSLAGGFAPSAAKAQTFTTIVTNGPVSNRVNVVFLSEGYTAGQLGQFLEDATNATLAFFNAQIVNPQVDSQPYTEYSNYFNVFAISVASAQSGSSHPAYPLTRNTYFNSSYDNVSDYIITIPPNPYDANANDGQAKVDALLHTFLPLTNNNLAFMLVNDPTPGGSDNYGKVAISYSGYQTGGFNVAFFIVHESGHALGALGDEYTNAYPGFPNTEEPNTTTQTNLSLIKWRAWIPAGTPVPTPATAQYENTIGLFQGAHYHASGWYRPQYNCCMASFDESFCPVCQEALILATYSKVRPLDGFSPAATSLSVSSAQMLTFNLNLLHPTTHALAVQWRTNGVAVIGATNSTFNIWPAQLGNGPQKIEADVADGTVLVRTDTQNLMKQTNTWNLNVSLPSVRIDSVQGQANGNFSFRISGSSPDAVAVQASTNLANWTTLQTSSPGALPFFYTNFAASASAPWKFYRAKTPP